MEHRLGLGRLPVAESKVFAIKIYAEGPTDVMIAINSRVLKFVAKHIPYSKLCDKLLLKISNFRDTEEVKLLKRTTKGYFGKYPASASGEERGNILWFQLLSSI